MKLLPAIFAASLILSSLKSIYPGLLPYLPVYLRNQGAPLVSIGSTLALYSSLNLTLAIVMFIVMYLLGRRVDLKLSLLSILLSLFVGSFFGGPSVIRV